MRLLLVALVVIGCSSEATHRTTLIGHDGGAEGGSAGSSGASGAGGSGGEPIVSEFGEVCNDAEYVCADGLECMGGRDERGTAMQVCMFVCGDARDACVDIGGSCVPPPQGGPYVCCPAGLKCGI